MRIHPFAVVGVNVVEAFGYGLRLDVHFIRVRNGVTRITRWVIGHRVFFMERDDVHLDFCSSATPLPGLEWIWVVLFFLCSPGTIAVKGVAVSLAIVQSLLEVCRKSQHKVKSDLWYIPSIAAL